MKRDFPFMWIFSPSVLSNLSIVKTNSAKFTVNDSITKINSAKFSIFWLPNGSACCTKISAFNYKNRRSREFISTLLRKLIPAASTWSPSFSSSSCSSFSLAWAFSSFFLSVNYSVASFCSLLCVILAWVMRKAAITILPKFLHKAHSDNKIIRLTSYSFYYIFTLCCCNIDLLVFYPV